MSRGGIFVVHGSEWSFNRDQRGDAARVSLLEHVEVHPHDLVQVASEALGISRLAVNRHVQQHGSDSAILREGHPRAVRCALAPLVVWERS